MYLQFLVDMPDVIANSVEADEKLFSNHGVIRSFRQEGKDFLLTLRKIGALLDGWGVPAEHIDDVSRHEGGHRHSPGGGLLNGFEDF